MAFRLGDGFLRSGTSFRCTFTAAGLALLLPVLLAPPLSAQARVQLSQPAASAAVPAGTVTGRVYAADTQHPVRFARVTLQSVASVSGASDPGADFRGSRGGGGADTRAGLDGSFSTAAAPGDYYVMASAPGFVSERDVLAAEVARGVSAASALAKIPTVHVSSGSVSNVSVLIEHGGAIAGRLQWEDGSPASGVTVTVVPFAQGATLPSTASISPEIQRIRSSNPGIFNQSDDRGAFRVSGLATGDYLLQIQVAGQSILFPGGNGPALGITPPLRLFYPGVFRRSEAKPISVRAGDDRDDLRLVLNLNGLHTVSGHITSSQAGQNIAAGRVSLADASDASLRLFGFIAANGDFTIPYVPAGNYSLSVSGASTDPNGGRGRSRGGDSGFSAGFQPQSTAVTVTDTDLGGVLVTLTPTAASPATTASAQ